MIIRKMEDIRKMSFVFLIIILSFSGAVKAQQPDEASDNTSPQPATASKIEREHSPSRAAMLSAALPGLGQVYNRRIWKVPIIYAGFGAVVYFVDFNNDEYQFWRNAYIAKVDENPNTVDKYPNVPANNLERAMNYYRRNLEISYIAGAALYLLNILDASVDAHLLDFDVSEDLTMKISPQVTPINSNLRGLSMTGLKLTLRF